MPHAPRAARVARTGTVLFAAVVLTGGGALARPPAPTGPPEPAQDTTAFGPALSLATDPALKKRLAAIEDYVREKSWPEVARILQALLDAREDVLLPIHARDADGKETTRWISVRAETNRILKTLPPAGREQYELSYGQKAAALLNEAKMRRNPALYAEVAQRFLYTKAGAEAVERLGTWHLDRGRSLMAARCFQQLLERDGPEQVAPAVLFQAALALHRSGDRNEAERVWRLFAARARDGLRLAGQQVALADLHRELERDRSRSAAAGATDWMMLGGGPTRTALTTGDPPAPDPRWQQDTLYESAARSWIESAVKQQEVRSQAVLPALFPIASGGRLICRTGRGIAAFSLKTGDLLWESETVWGLDNLAGDAKLRAAVNPWATFWLQSHPHALLENSTLGTLSTDGRRVYVVEDLAVPPQATTGGFNGRRGMQAPEPPAVPVLADASLCNRLRAIDLEGGKVIWEVGGKSSERDGETGLKDSCFLGPPLPLGGKLYALTDKNQELRLVCLDGADGGLVWSQTLALANTKLVQDPARRIHAAPLACADGILLCPTNAGGLFAIDLLAHSFIWAYAYREPPPPPPPQPGFGRRRPFRRPLAPVDIVSEWKTSAPVVHEGRVLIAAPDAAVLHCLNLRNGRLLWKEDRTADDLYLAGAFGDRVLLVGKQSCRALALADGKLLWKVDTAPPSGHGVAVGSTYYLPVKQAAEAKGPAVLAIDLEKGKVTSRMALAGRQPPGNLLFHDGLVISQTLDSLMVFPQARK